MSQDTASSTGTTTFGASAIGRYLDDLAAKIPAPGGGAVAALHAAQAAALVAIAPIGLQLGIDPAIIVGFYGAAYGYFILPTYPSDLACIGFDRTGTTRIGKFVINPSFIIPGFISVITSCVVGTALAQALLP